LFVNKADQRKGLCNRNRLTLKLHLGKKKKMYARMAESVNPSDSLTKGKKGTPITNKE